MQYPLVRFLQMPACAPICEKHDLLPEINLHYAGCGILGTGGGGSPYINRLKVMRELDRCATTTTVPTAAITAHIVASAIMHGVKDHFCVVLLISVNMHGNSNAMHCDAEVESSE